jgi:hypothetical protein
MLLPVLLGSGTVEAANRMATHHHAAPVNDPLTALLATAVHTTAYLAITGLLAWVVYRKFGLSLLRTSWINFDLVWGGALVAAGLFTLLA